MLRENQVCLVECYVPHCGGERPRMGCDPVWVNLCQGRPKAGHPPEKNVELLRESSMWRSMWRSQGDKVCIKGFIGSLKSNME